MIGNLYEMVHMLAKHMVILRKALEYSPNTMVFLPYLYDMMIIGTIQDVSLGFKMYAWSILVVKAWIPCLVNAFT